MTDSNAPLTVAILHGVFEGPAISKRFRRALERSGYKVIKDPATADIIFAHSGGCFLIPGKNRARLVILVGLSYWSGRVWQWIPTTMRKIMREIRIRRRQKQLHTQWIKELQHAYYAYNLKAYLQMWSKQGMHNDWNNGQPQVVIRNRHDVYCPPDVADLPFKGPRAFISFPGEHDDCWDNPQHYIHLIQSLL